jgi:hypothetical protein
VFNGLVMLTEYTLQTSVPIVFYKVVFLLRITPLQRYHKIFLSQRNAYFPILSSTGLDFIHGVYTKYITFI